MLIRALTLLAACATADKQQVPFGDEVIDTDAAEDTDIPDTDVEVDSDAPDTDPQETGREDTAADEPADTAPDWTREIEVMLTADDAWEMYIDGTPVPPAPGANLWSTVDTVIVQAPGRRHVVAVHARDVASVISGFIAAVWVSHEPYSLTGDARWRMTATAPPPEWILKRFDDSTWGLAPVCSPNEANIWGGRPTELLGLGAQWVWQTPCLGLGQIWLRLEIE